MNMAVQELLLVWMVSTTLSSGAVEFKDLLAVDMSNHELKSIPSNYTRNITTLILSDNFIEMTSENVATLQSYSNLTELNLKGNLLTVLPGKLFKSMSKLEVLLLSNNKIKRVEPKAFTGLVNLRELDLSNNLLETFPGDLLVGVKKLSILRLQGNKLQTLNISMDEKLLQNVDVEDNSWICTCSFLNMIKLMTDSGVNISSGAVCTSPEELADKRILDNNTRCLVKPTTTTEPPSPTTKPSSVPNITNSPAGKNNTNVSDKDIEPGSGRPSLGNTWKFLLGVVVIALTTSMVIVCAVKSPSWYKLLFNYRHQRLREDSNVLFSLDPGQTETAVNHLENGLDEDDDDDGYIEDGYIEEGDYKDGIKPWTPARNPDGPQHGTLMDTSTEP